MNTITK